MTNPMTALPIVLELARKVQETGRDKSLNRIFSGTADEVDCYAENVRTAQDSIAEAIKAIGELMAIFPEPELAEAQTVSRIGWALVMLAEMSGSLAGEAFALSERVPRDRKGGAE